MAVFLVFALAYFLSTLVRAITGTLAPTLSAELNLQARDLGLLAGGYFFGFALTQLPMGSWLDRYGPKRVILAFLSLAVLGCVAFGLATSFSGLLAARVLTGMGVSACLMAPLTGYRRWLAPTLQLRANAWMLMTGSLGMVAATLPVQWLMPVTGWRGLFGVLAVLMLLAMGLIKLLVPTHGPASQAPGAAEPTVEKGYGMVWRQPYFRKMVGLGLVNYGGMVAIQTLWAGPWMVQVAGYTPEQAAGGLFAINLCMLVAFWLWGWSSPALARNGWSAERIIAWGLPGSFVVLGLTVWLGPQAGWAWWAAFCVLSSCVSLAQPAVAMALPAAYAGRALSAFNLAVFAGVFIAQWGLGLLIDAWQLWGLEVSAAYRAAMASFGVLGLLAYLVFLVLPAQHLSQPSGDTLKP